MAESLRMIPLSGHAPLCGEWYTASLGRVWGEGNEMGGSRLGGRDEVPQVRDDIPQAPDDVQLVSAFDKLHEIPLTALHPIRS